MEHGEALTLVAYRLQSMILMKEEADALLSAGGQNHQRGQRRERFRESGRLDYDPVGASGPPLDRGGCGNIDVKEVKRMTPHVSFCADIGRRAPISIDIHVDPMKSLGNETGERDGVGRHGKQHVNRAPLPGDRS